MGLKSFFRRLWGGLKSTGNLFSKLFGADALESFQLTARLLLASALGRIVFSVVEELSTLDLSNEEKRRLAFERIVAAARQAPLSGAGKVGQGLVPCRAQAWHLARST